LDTEQPLTFACAGHTLVGILHHPRTQPRRGVVIVVGGPQYRAGSHRQFVLLARALADAGLAVLRFDQRGCGDSDGEAPGFEHMDADIDAAINALRAHCPTVSEVFLWGLCDAASAILLRLRRPAPGIAGAMLVNPWARSEDGLAAARVRHYYGARLASVEFWGKLLRGNVDLAESVRGAALSVLALLRRRKRPAAGLPARLGDALAHCPVRLLLILSSDDLTAVEFEQTVLAPLDKRDWPVLSIRRLAGANHTYSRADWRDRVHAWVLSWLAAEPDEVRHAMADKAD
jgi:exosortase A-associated hydrolase 1